jgi:invasion protein IalB
VRRMKFLLTAMLSAGAGLAVIASAQAQAPQRTTATYEDWTVRCETPAASPAQKSCEMVQTTQMQGQAAPVTQIAIGRPLKTDPLRLVIGVPVNVWLATPAKLVYDDKQPGLAAAFTRCVPQGCFADTTLSDDMIKRLRARTDAGRLEFKDSTQRDVAFPVSFKGFGQAFDALMKE